MPEIVGVRFRPVTKIYFFDPNNIDELEDDTRVIVETSRGIEMGTVVKEAHEVPESEIKGKLKRVIRKATPVDLLQVEQYKAQEQSALEKCEALIKELNVPIRPIDAEYNFDGSRLLISFTAEQRVDFRDLVKALARELRTKIEMKQVGARDETKILDGYGRCGRRLCCSSWLTEFHPVSIKMAKNQGLPLAPSEISGLCGRLLCCLAYENDLYDELKKSLPKVGVQIKTPDGTTGFVRGLNVIKEAVLVQVEEEQGYVEFPVSDIEVLQSGSGGKQSDSSSDDSGQSKRRKRRSRKRRNRSKSGDGNN